MESSAEDLSKVILEVHSLISRMKAMRRTGWVERGLAEAESVADHSYAVALLSMILAEMRGLNVLEAVRMALIHDLAEAVTGDLTPEQKEKIVEEYRAAEREVIESIAGMLPRDVGEKYLEAWRRYSEGLTEEAELVRMVDKLEMGLQAVDYLEKTGDRRLLEIYRSALESVRDDPAMRRALMEALGS